MIIMVFVINFQAKTNIYQSIIDDRLLVVNT